MPILVEIYEIRGFILFSTSVIKRVELFSLLFWLLFLWNVLHKIVQKTKLLLSVFFYIYFLDTFFVFPHVFTNLTFVDFSCVSVATSTLLTWAMLRRQPQRLLFWVLGLWRPNWRVLKWVLQLRTVAATVDQAAPATHATASEVKIYNLEAEITVIYVSTNNKNYVLCLIKWSWLEFANSNVLGYLLRVFEVWLLSVWLVYHKYVNLNHQSLLINGLLLVLYE